MPHKLRRRSVDEALSKKIKRYTAEKTQSKIWLKKSKISRNSENQKVLNVKGVTIALSCARIPKSLYTRSQNIGISDASHKPVTASNDKHRRSGFSQYIDF